ncbi:hypothetical protein Rsub_12175 [Raphidocelis subcapitata]|uniref:Uncharacterized protein n=1 Tax=Raphidocelis subcapitata TaxID=307507 RepID=A0A2V0PHS8_9CHLO|nr:hypothetical protein Rsub_12175 [Raphidocelis subcapitata]|eukprot:GBF99371.1 hypothetical protein Rsub_12175 [Raphidocelis subcapitata]
MHAYGRASRDAVKAAAAGRREALAALGAAGALFAARPARAISFSPTVCADQDTGEQADECRARILARDTAAQEEALAEYAKRENRSVRVASGVPVSEMSDEYTRATLQLADKLEAYFTTDVYDKSRGALIKDVKGEAQAWVTKYARGGSVRKQSARRFYVAVDAVLGHLASNGLAPFPASKIKVVRATLEEARGLLAEAK